MTKLVLVHKTSRNQIFIQFRSINEISSFLRADAFSIPDWSLY